MNYAAPSLTLDQNRAIAAAMWVSAMKVLAPHPPEASPREIQTGQDAVRQAEKAERAAEERVHADSRPQRLLNISA